MMISEFQDAYRNRHKLAEGWKKSGKKIFGYFCNYTPEELIYATGIIPVRIRGSSENVELADAHINSFCCSFIRPFCCVSSSAIRFSIVSFCSLNCVSCSARNFLVFSDFKISTASV